LTVRNAGEGNSVFQVRLRGTHVSRPLRRRGILPALGWFGCIGTSW